MIKWNVVSHNILKRYTYLIYINPWLGNSHKNHLYPINKKSINVNLSKNGLFNILLKSEAKKQDTFKNWPLIKNLQFLSNPHETW